MPSPGAQRRRLQTDRARPLAPPQPYTTRRLYINSLVGWPSVDTSHHLPPCRRRVRGGVWCGGGVRWVVVALTDSLYTHHCVAHGTTRGRFRQIRALGLHSLTAQPTGVACACEWPWSGCGAGRSVGHMSLWVVLDTLRIISPHHARHRSAVGCVVWRNSGPRIATPCGLTCGYGTATPRHHPRM